MLAEEIPFYAETILRDQKKGVFFEDDGLVSSNKLRKYLWKDLTAINDKLPDVAFYLDSEVNELIMDAEHNCTGFILKDGKSVDADMAILAMGLANKHLLTQYGVRLPLWSVWGAAIRGKLKDSTECPPKGGVSFHSQRCITAAPDGQNMIVAGTRWSWKKVKCQRKLFIRQNYEKILKTFSAIASTKVHCKCGWPLELASPMIYR